MECGSEVSSQTVQSKRPLRHNLNERKGEGENLPLFLLKKRTAALRVFYHVSISTEDEVISCLWLDISSL